MDYNYYAVAAAGLFALCVVRYISSYISDYQFSKAHGCKPAPRLPQLERIIGYQLMTEQKTAQKEKRLLKLSQSRYASMGANTWSASIMGNNFVGTCDEENVKAILATNFKDFGLGKRIDSFGKLLGKGIFTTDGEHWEHSRVSHAAI